MYSDNCIWESDPALGLAYLGFIAAYHQVDIIAECLNYKEFNTISAKEYVILYFVFL